MYKLFGFFFLCLSFTYFFTDRSTDEIIRFYGISVLAMIAFGVDYLSGKIDDLRKAK